MNRNTPMLAPITIKTIQRQCDDMRAALLEIESIDLDELRAQDAAWVAESDARAIAAGKPLLEPGHYLRTRGFDSFLRNIESAHVHLTDYFGT